MEKYQDLISGERGYFVVNKENIEKVKDLLSDNRIQYTSDYVTGYDVFAEEEALYRMEQFENENNIKLCEEDLDEIYSNLTGAYRISENYLDEDELSNQSFHIISAVAGRQPDVMFNIMTNQIDGDSRYNSDNIDITREEDAMRLMYHSDNDCHTVGNIVFVDDKFNDDEFREICDKNNFAYIINE